MVISAASQGPPGGEEPARAAALEPSRTAAAIGDEDLPLVDPAVLEELEDELYPPALATNFAKDYVEFWPQRERRLIAALAAADSRTALDAAISVRVSSDMVGARRLAALARALEAALRGGDLSGGPVGALVSVHGRATVDELQARYLRYR